MSKRNAGLVLHASYVNGMKVALAKVLEERNQELRLDDLPGICGLRELPIRCPPMFDAAFGYRGRMRFVAFHASPVSGCIVHSDGGSDLPIPNPNDWITFVNHPAVHIHIEGFTTFFGRVGINRILSAEEFSELVDEQKGQYCKRFHALVVDRMVGKLYVAGWEELKMFQPCAEPDGDELHVALPDGKLVSPGNEKYRQAVDISVIEALWEYLNRQLDNPDTLERLAAWYAGAGQPEEGLVLLKQVAAKFPDRTRSARFEHALASIGEATHDYVAATSALEKYVVRCSQVEPHTRVRLGQLYLHVGKYAEAEEQLFKAKEQSLSVMNEDWHVLAARASVGFGRLEEASRICEGGIIHSIRERESSEAFTGALQMQLAEIAALSNNYATALDHCNRALAQPLYDADEFDSQAIATYRLSWWFSQEARVANAARVFKLSHENLWNPDLALGYLYLAMNRYPDAAARLNLAYRGQKTAEILWLLGLSYLAMKDRDKAAGLFNELSGLFPTDERGDVGMAIMRAAEGANDAALDRCKAAIFRNPNSGEAQAVLSYLYWSAGNFGAAAEAFDLAKRRGFQPHHILASPQEDNGKSIRFLTLGLG